MKTYKFILGIILIPLLQGCYSELLLRSDSGGEIYYEPIHEDGPIIIIIDEPPPIYLPPPVIIEQNPESGQSNKTVYRKDQNKERPRNEENNTRNTNSADRNIPKRNHR